MIRSKLLIVLLFTVTISCAQKTKTLDKKEVLVEIDSLTVKKHLYTLASDEMEGRKAGTPGIEKAAQYIEAEFERIGLSKFQDSKTFRQNLKKKGIGFV